MNGTLKKNLDLFLEDATKEEMELLEFLFNGIRKKRLNQSGTYLTSTLNMTENQLNENEYEISMPNTPYIQNTLNITHGGITATLIDTAMGIFANKIIPSHLAAVTSEIKVNYVAPGIGEKLRCIASIIHKGSKTIIMEGKVYRDDHKLIAHATGSFFIIPRNF